MSCSLTGVFLGFYLFHGPNNPIDRCFLDLFLPLGDEGGTTGEEETRERLSLAYTSFAFLATGMIRLLTAQLSRQSSQ